MHNARSKEKKTVFILWQFSIINCLNQKAFVGQKFPFTPNQLPNMNRIYILFDFKYTNVSVGIHFEIWWIHFETRKFIVSKFLQSHLIGCVIVNHYFEMNQSLQNNPFRLHRNMNHLLRNAIEVLHTEVNKYTSVYESIIKFVMREM